MEPFFFFLILVGLLFIIFPQILFYGYMQKALSMSNLPPGRTGWPVIGESLEFLSAGWKGHPEKFVLDRMIKYSPECFKTSILGQPMAFLCGPLGNKFLFYNGSKLVTDWWPDSLKKIFPDTLQANPNEAPKKVKQLLVQFLKPEALRRYIGIMDAHTQRHFMSEWEGKDVVFVFPLAKKYASSLACHLFLSVDEPDHVARLVDPFHQVASGIISLPIDFPGTPFHKAVRASKFLIKEFTTIIRQKKLDLAIQKENPTQDLLSRMLTAVDEDGKHLISESIVAETIMGLLIAGHDGVTSAITLSAKYLAELPHIYDAVYREQMEIAKTKAPGELLNWEDIQKMKYSWNMACEVMRLMPPSPGKFRQAINEFTYAGFTIPKGWKLHWSAYSTHMNPQYFQEPEKFDPTRFEGNGPAPYTYMPFGGGPGMCPGREFARLEILVFIHNLVKRFRWETLLPNEKIIIHLSPAPAKGLPIRLIPHEISNKQD